MVSHFKMPRIALYGAIGAALVACVVFLRWDAAQDARRSENVRQAVENGETLENIIDAISDPRTPDDIRERLRQLSQ